MKIISWNVNGIRAAHRKGFVDWLNTQDAGIVALQETRARREQVPADIVEHDDWHFHLTEAERPGYSGVGLLSRKAPDAVDDGLGVEEFDAEGRLHIARFGELTVANGYFPNGNGKNRDNSRVPFKLDFYRRLFDLLEKDRKRGARILVMGDLNTAHREIDLARPKQNHETSGFRPEEREELDRWLRSGWTDTFRHFVPEDHPEAAGRYSWWSQRFGVREKNIGWRLDYVLASPGAMDFVRAAEIHSEVLGSDHCPVSVTLNPAVVDP